MDKKERFEKVAINKLRALLESRDATISMHKLGAFSLSLDTLLERHNEEIAFFRDYLNIRPEVEVRETKETGRGVFAKEKIIEDETIISLEGVFYTTDPHYRNCEQLTDINNPYLLEVAEKIYLLPNEPARYINHSCEPNARIHIGWEYDNVQLVALHDIEPDEEITFDYSTTSTDYFDTWKMDCSCGSAKCRKTISGFRYLPEEYQIELFNKEYVKDYVTEGTKTKKQSDINYIIGLMEFDDEISDDLINDFKDVALINGTTRWLGHELVQCDKRHDNFSGVLGNLKNNLERYKNTNEVDYLFDFINYEFLDTSLARDFKKYVEDGNSKILELAREMLDIEADWYPQKYKEIQNKFIFEINKLKAKE